jgi:hypothetical protein
MRKFLSVFLINSILSGLFSPAAAQNFNIDTVSSPSETLHLQDIRMVRGQAGRVSGKSNFPARTAAF